MRVEGRLAARSAPLVYPRTNHGSTKCFEAARSAAHLPLLNPQPSTLLSYPWLFAVTTTLIHG